MNYQKFDRAVKGGKAAVETRGRELLVETRPSAPLCPEREAGALVALVGQSDQVGAFVIVPTLAKTKDQAPVLAQIAGVSSTDRGGVHTGCVGLRALSMRL